MIGCFIVPGLQAQERPTKLEVPTIEVIGTTPVPGIGTEIEEVPANVQVITDEAFDKIQAINLPDFLQQAMPSVSINEMANNPYQPNLMYRGFIASPLLGAPQGMSVFQDGVRINEPFGDVISYDLIPQAAISSMTLMPGSNPLFGLNTLGGAIEIRTKSGAYYPGTEVDLSGGSHGRKEWSISRGSQDGEVDYFFSASSLEEDGWRYLSHSDVKQLFGKVGWENDDTDIDVSITHGNTDLNGNGVLPYSMLQQKRDQTYTIWDNTSNHMTMGNVNASHWINDTVMLSGVTYLRRNYTSTYNGDANDNFDGAGEDDQGEVNRTYTDQQSQGVGLQMSWLTDAHNLALGFSYDRSRSDFLMTEQEGEEFSADRRVAELDDDIETANSLLGRTQTTSVYLSENYAMTDALSLIVSGRYNRTTVKADDRHNADGRLNANYTYNKFNPSLGFTYLTGPSSSFYANWGQGNRAPTPIELGCADPDNACSLPNAMAADPFLEQVVSRTIEAGFRGQMGDGIQYTATVFSSENKDDILFLAANTAGQGYFKNFGKTKRQGAEIGLNGMLGERLDWGINYSYVDATFESPACIVSEVNSAEDEDNCGEDQIRITAGNSIPGIPKHQLRLRGDWAMTSSWNINLTAVSFSDSYVHGNENNLHNERGKVPSYQVFNLATSYQTEGNWQIYARISNLLDKDYSTAGILAENAFDASGNFITTLSGGEPDWEDETFFAPGAPRSFYVGLKYIIGGQ